MSVIDWKFKNELTPECPIQEVSNQLDPWLCRLKQISEYEAQAIRSGGFKAYREDCDRSLERLRRLEKEALEEEEEEEEALREDENTLQAYRTVTTASKHFIDPNATLKKYYGGRIRSAESRIRKLKEEREERLARHFEVKRQKTCLMMGKEEEEEEDGQTEEASTYQYNPELDETSEFFFSLMVKKKLGNSSETPSNRVLHTYSPEFSAALKASDSARWKAKRELDDRLETVVDRIENVVELERSAIATNRLEKQRSEYAESLAEARKLEAEAKEEIRTLKRDTEVLAACESILRAEKLVTEQKDFLSTYYDERQKALQAHIKQLQIEKAARQSKKADVEDKLYKYFKNDPPVAPGNPVEPEQESHYDTCPSCGADCYRSCSDCGAEW